ncbi:MAG: Vitamin B12 import ATP-binding protein BtuD [Candidatus Omnitrophica bacterium]|nr:Vitamin B12 import ATP-binding protein BtuD [Candidatus Omnitrophota bacterium]
MSSHAPSLNVVLPPESHGSAGSGARRVSARELRYAYAGRRPEVVDGVSLSVSAGEVVVVLGRSGSGKTTLLRLLAGLLKPQAGTVEGRREGTRLAYIPQTLGLVRSTSVLENVLVGALGRLNALRSTLGLFGAVEENKARTLLVGLGLSGKSTRRVSTLSGGERQRVAIARALMGEPDIVLADEFVSQLDPVTAEEVLEMVKGLAGQGVGFVITTHDVELGLRLADRVVVLKNGRAQLQGRAQGLSARAVLEALR